MSGPQQAPRKVAVETAFRELYEHVGFALGKLLDSKEPQTRQFGLLLTGLEYENLVTALNLALDAQVSILYIYLASSNYLNTTQDQQRGLMLGQSVLAQFEKYPEEKLAGKLGYEFAGVIDNIAMRQSILMRYAEAEESYQKVLSILQKNKAYTEDEIKKFEASIYLNLGIVAQMQRQWAQAEQYCQHALQLFIVINDRYDQAHTYYQLGKVAQEQRQWKEAEQYCQHALQIYIEYNARYEQARTYHQLGRVAQEQRQWSQAEQYYQQALQINIEFKDRYGQAGTYHQLGMVAQDQRQWAQARDYFLQALEIFVEFKDAYSRDIVLGGLALLWHESGDASILAMIAKRLGLEVSEVEKLLREKLGEGSEGEKEQ